MNGAPGSLTLQTKCVDSSPILFACAQGQNDKKIEKGRKSAKKLLDIENSIMQSSSWREEIMANFEAEDGTTRDDLVQRVALMEEMITEGRKSTVRYGWIFVLWGADRSGAGWLAVGHAAFALGDELELADCHCLWSCDSVHRNGDSASQERCRLQ
jgi:hypothetical protein